MIKFNYQIIIQLLQMHKLAPVLVVFLILSVSVCNAQSNKETALQKAREAVRLEDKEGKVDEAIKLLEEACTLDPDNITYPYELAYAYEAKKDYKKASDIVEKLLTHKDATGRVYQLLGNLYDFQGKPAKAIETYEAGLKKFPAAGELYLELGNMNLATKEYNKALGYYEKGIEADPAFPSNYYWAAKLFLNSDEEVWGMIYGEIFVNLERNSKRTAEISKLLFDTYKSQIKFTSETAFTVSFSKTAVIDVSSLKDPSKFKLPFGNGCYEMLLTMAVIGEKSIDIRSLDKIRSRFISAYFSGDHSRNYPNILFDYEKQVKDAGHAEAYNHWIVMKGDPDGFQKWYDLNQDKWNAFTAWFSEHRLMLDPSHKFYRAQY